MDVRHQPGLCGVTSLSTNNVNTANPDQKSAYSYDDLLACAHGQLFGPGNARLPLPGMLMLDRISHIADHGGEYGKGEIIAELDIHPDLWFFDCHFETDPVMPGCLGLMPPGSCWASSSAGWATPAGAVPWAWAR